jgi:hypothetical protein
MSCDRYGLRLRHNSRLDSWLLNLR